MRFFGKLYVQVLIGVVAGVALGFFYQSLGGDLKPLGDVFIKLIKMVFAPIIFATVVLGGGGVPACRSARRGDEPVAHRPGVSAPAITGATALNSPAS